METSGGITVVSYPSRFIKFTVFLELNADCSLRLPNVGVVGVVGTPDVVPHNFSLLAL